LNIYIISFTKAGAYLCEKIIENQKNFSNTIQGFTMKKDIQLTSVKQVQNVLREWTKAAFEKADGIVYIGACGIAVRSIAPFLEDKKTDPAVVVMDEKGNYIIPILSGHLGGANYLANILSELTGGESVITTATDINELFAVDIFAKENRLYISDMKLAKEISAFILDNGKVGLRSDFQVNGQIPLEILLESEYLENPPKIEIYITIKDKLKKQELDITKTLLLIPKIVTLGIGCKKGTTKEQIQSLVDIVLEEQEISFYAIEKVASIDLKKEEIGLINFANTNNLPFVTYTVEELSKVQGEFLESKFVKEITGIGNVCERSAVLGNNILLQKKVSKDGVTVALGIREWSVKFE
jgi:Cobalamin biosynthesis protein CbiG